MIDYDDGIEVFDLSPRSYSQLRNAGIRTVGDLVSKDRDYISRLRNIGVKSVNEIEWKVADYGMSLGMSPVNKLALFGTDAIKGMISDVDVIASSIQRLNKELDMVIDKLKVLKGIVDSEEEKDE